MTYMKTSILPLALTGLLVLAGAATERQGRQVKQEVLPLTAPKTELAAEAPP